MAANLKLIPRAERLLEGKITAIMNDSQTTVTVDNPPLITALPSYMELDPDSATFRELCRVINVSGSTITLERGLNNGGTGIAHADQTSYKFKFTSRHWETVATALESGYLFEDSSYVFTRVSTSSFKITAAGVDRTDTYTVGRKVRLNGTTVVVVVSSSYSTPDTTVVVDETTVPATITSVELAIDTKGDNSIVLTPNTKVQLGSDADGDMYYRASSVLARLAKGTASQQLRMNSGATAPEWFTPTAAASFWTSYSGAYASGTTITVATDLTGIFKKGVSLKWLSSADALKIGKVVSSSYSSPNTTITIVGSTVEANDKSFYYGADVMSETFIVPGNQSTGTNVSKTWTAKTEIYPISVDAVVSTAGTTNSTDYDVNDDGTTIIATKPAIASTATTDLDNVVSAPTTAIAVNSVVTVDIDAASTTQAIDGYITLFYLPSWWISRT